VSTEVLAKDLQLAIVELRGFGVVIVDVYQVDLDLSPASFLPEPTKLEVLKRYRLRYRKIQWNEMALWSDPIPFTGYRFRIGSGKDIAGSGEDTFTSICAAIKAPNDRRHPYMPPREPLTSTTLPFNIGAQENYVRPLAGHPTGTVPISHISKMLYHAIAYPTTPVKLKHARIHYVTADVGFSSDAKHTVAIVCRAMTDFDSEVVSAIPVRIVEPKPTSTQLRLPSKALSDSLLIQILLTCITLQTQFLFLVVPYIWGCDREMLTTAGSEYSRHHTCLWDSVLFPESRKKVNSCPMLVIEECERLIPLAYTQNANRPNRGTVEEGKELFWTHRRYSYMWTFTCAPKPTEKIPRASDRMNKQIGGGPGQVDQWSI
jgi:hypothetical protein